MRATCGWLVRQESKTSVSATGFGGKVLTRIGHRRRVETLMTAKGTSNSNDTATAQGPTCEKAVSLHCFSGTELDSLGVEKTFA